MDYEVFMVSSIREAYLETNDPSAAVVRGRRNATRIVTAAALIMFSVFASFVGTHDATLKTIAFGLGVGVLVDAFVVRMTLVPATLALLGHASWWLPGRLERTLPDLDVEGAGRSRIELGDGSIPRAEAAGVTAELISIRDAETSSKGGIR
jgi:putative drug exporter of the RND superfamily